MKALAVVFILFSLLPFVSAGEVQQTGSPKEVPAGEAFTIKIGKQVNIKDTRIVITFLSVPEDSRCPTDTDCIWAGNANPAFEIRKAKKKKIVANLNTMSEPKAVEFLGYSVKLVGLSPSPTSKGSINPGDYEAILIVTHQESK